ncbi:MAG: DUF1987 domain-containing protein [Bacteroidetes bacterium]|nr:DUF1987 domain-containing protein [Bacteroidota bacterium]
MIKPLRIEETEDTPKVLLDQENGTFEITGRSFPEDASKFYFSVLSWVEEYAQEPSKETNFYFYLDYFNSTSMKQFIELLIRLERISETGKKVKIIWTHSKNDELMAFKGKEIENMINLPFEFKIIE